MSTLTFYMKSGNKFKIRFVKKTWEVKCSGNEVTSVSIPRYWFAKFISPTPIMVALDLTQIEYMTAS